MGFLAIFGPKIGSNFGPLLGLHFFRGSKITPKMTPRPSYTFLMTPKMGPVTTGFYLKNGPKIGLKWPQKFSVSRPKWPKTLHRKEVAYPDRLRAYTFGSRLRWLVNPVSSDWAFIGHFCKKLESLSSKCFTVLQTECRRGLAWVPQLST